MRDDDADPRCGESRRGGGPAARGIVWALLARQGTLVQGSIRMADNLRRRGANYWAPLTRKRHQQEHRPQRPTERSDPTQHAKGRTGDCPGPHKETTTRRNVTQGGYPCHPKPRFHGGKKGNLQKGNIDSGHFWCTNFWVPDLPSSLLMGGGGGQGRGRAGLADVFGSISAALVDAARADGTQGDPPPPRDRGQQGAAGWLRDGQGRGASPPLSDRRQQAAAGQSVVLAQGQPGAAALGQGCQGAAGWLRDGQGSGASPPLGDQGQRGAAGQGPGQQAAADFSVVQAQGQPEAAALGQGCQGQGQGQGQGGSAPPPARRSPPPSLRGRAGRAQERGSATRGGRAARGADRQGRPAQRRDAAARLPPRGGGLLSLGFTRQVQSSGGGGAQPPAAAPASAGADGGAHSPRSGQGRSSEDPT